MHKAEIRGLERTIRLPRSAWPRQAAQALGFQDAVDRVSVEVGQKVGDHKGQVIPRKAGGATQGADNGPLFPLAFQGSLCGRLEWSWQSAALRLRHLPIVSVDTP